MAVDSFNMGEERRQSHSPFGLIAEPARRIAVASLITLIAVNPINATGCENAAQVFVCVPNSRRLSTIPTWLRNQGEEIFPRKAKLYASGFGRMFSVLKKHVDVRSAIGNSRPANNSSATARAINLTNKAITGTLNSIATITDRRPHQIAMSFFDRAMSNREPAKFLSGVIGGGKRASFCSSGNFFHT